MDNNTVRLLIIAYSAGYEQGHHDTVEGYFCGNGRDSEHDEQAAETIDEMLRDGSFDREVTA
jgi:hypothetical protein